MLQIRVMVVLVGAQKSRIPGECGQGVPQKFQMGTTLMGNGLEVISVMLWQITGLHFVHTLRL